jgi:uroporphyrinogen-III decarboxylase
MSNILFDSSRQISCQKENLVKQRNIWYITFSRVVEEVAQSAVQQAEETESAVNTLDSNINGLNFISQTQP